MKVGNVTKVGSGTNRGSFAKSGIFVNVRLKLLFEVQYASAKHLLVTILI